MKKLPLILMLAWFVMVYVWWYIAFAPIPNVNREWLDRFREICFAMDLSGKPSLTTWMMLFLAPLFFLFAIGLIWFNDLKMSLQILKNRSWVRLLIIILLLLGLGELIWIQKKLRPVFFQPSQPVLTLENLPVINQPAPDIELTNQRGEKFSLKKLKGKTILLGFVFAHCEAMCPLVAQNSKLVYEKINNKNFVVVLITLDPKRDTPAALPGLQKKWGLPDSFEILSGSVPEVSETLAKYNMYFQPDEKTGDIAHPALYYVINQEGMIRYMLNNPSVELLMSALEKLM